MMELQTPIAKALVSFVGEGNSFEHDYLAERWAFTVSSFS
jgi:hypothetical protein